MTKEGMHQKMVASLARKGFDFDIIKRACKEMFDVETCENINNFDET